MYHPTYVNRLFSMCKRHVKVPFTFYCLTEDSQGLDDEVVTLPTNGVDVAQWLKFSFLKPNFIPERTTIVLDLDNVITKDFTPLLNTGTEKDFCMRDEFFPRQSIIGNCKCYQGQFLKYNPKYWHHIWDFYVSEIRTEWNGKPQGEQHSLSYYHYLNQYKNFVEVDPKLIWSYKNDYGLFNQEGVMCAFHGNPNPHEVILDKSIPPLKKTWVYKNWK